MKHVKPRAPRQPQEPRGPRPPREPQRPARRHAGRRKPVRPRPPREPRVVQPNPIPPITFPEALPVFARRDEIAKAIAENRVVIVSGETGSRQDYAVAENLASRSGAVSARAAPV